MAEVTRGVRDLRFRIEELQAGIQSALVDGEGREPAQITAAMDAWLVWIRELAEDGDIEGALTVALESYLEHVPYALKSNLSVETEFSLAADPAWLFDEFLLVVALFMITTAHAAAHAKALSADRLALAGMWYADAVEAFARWHEYRGPAQCRNPRERDVKRHQYLERLNAAPYVEAAKVTAAREAASRAVRSRHAKDPRQKAKQEIQDEWTHRRKKGRVNATIFADEMAGKYEATGLKSGTIANWQTQWNATFTLRAK